MIKLKHKKHTHEKEDGKFIIYYNISDILLGIALVSLAIFFTFDRLNRPIGTCYEGNAGAYRTNN